MKILLYGAGVIGTLYASRLQAGGRQTNYSGTRLTACRHSAPWLGARRCHERRSHVISVGRPGRCRKLMWA
jgi:hypothetical protein